MLLEIEKPELNNLNNFNENFLVDHREQRRPCKRLCGGRLCKCTMIFICISGLNTLSFFMGMYYEAHKNLLLNDKSDDL